MSNLNQLITVEPKELRVLELGERSVSWVTKKGDVQSLTTEAAVFKGGQALKALRDVAAEVALTKAIKGRYTAMCDIVGTQFPAVLKAAVKLYGEHPASRKTRAAEFCEAVLRESPRNLDKGWNEKQLVARELANAFLIVLDNEAAAKEAAEQKRLEDANNTVENDAGAAQQ